MAYSNLQTLFPKKGTVMFLMLAPVPTLGKGRTAVFVHYKQLKKQSNKQDHGNKLAYIVLFDKVSMIQANILKSALSKPL